VFGVFDSARPQVYFAETRERALAEVMRANEIVARYPNTISMAHLREMDGAWRVARGLPLLPEPDGPRLIVDDWLQSTQPRGDSRRSRESPPPVPEGGASLRPDHAAALASELAAMAGAQEAAVKARAAAERTVLLASSLARATADAHEPLQRLRTVLQSVYGEHAPAAEAAFRRISVEEGVERATRLLREHPRELLTGPQPRTLPGGIRAREAAAALAAECAPQVARLDHVLRETVRHLGMDETAVLDPVAAGRRLRDVLPEHQRAAAAAHERERQLAADVSRLRGAWRELGPEEQAAARRAVPDVERLLGLSPRTRDRGGAEL
jgi:hypothetical protein